HESEVERVGISTLGSDGGYPPMVADAAAALYCNLHVVHRHKTNSILVADVHQIAVGSTLMANGRLDLALYRPLGRASGRYTTVGSEFKVARPSYDGLQTSGLAA